MNFSTSIQGFIFGVLIAPFIPMSAYAQITNLGLGSRGFQASGNMVWEGAVIGVNVILGQGAMVGAGAKVGDNSTVGKNAHIFPNAVVGCFAEPTLGVPCPGGAAPVGVQIGQSAQVAEGAFVPDGTVIGKPKP